MREYAWYAGKSNPNEYTKFFTDEAYVTADMLTNKDSVNKRMGQLMKLADQFKLDAAYDYFGGNVETAKAEYDRIMLNTTLPESLVTMYAVIDFHLKSAAEGTAPRLAAGERNNVQ